jgi:hypothetical protein
MLRKLALSGLLQFVEPGTAAQVFFGCVLAFLCFGVQVGPTLTRLEHSTSYNFC